MGTHDVVDAVVVEIVDTVAVPVSMNTALNARHGGDVAVKGADYALIELLRIRACMHHGKTLLALGGKVSDLILHVGQIRYTDRMVKFERVGVEADETDIACREREIEVAENLSVNRRSGRQTVVVAEERHIGHFQSVEDIALTLKFGTQTEVGHVARVDDKIEVVALVERFNGGHSLVIPALRIADDGKAQCRFALAGLLDLRDVGGVDVFFALDTRVVGVVFGLAPDGDQSK